MSKFPWEMSPEEIRGAAGLPVEKQEKTSSKKPWEMTWDAIREFFSPTAPQPLPPKKETPVAPSKAPDKAFNIEEYIQRTASVESSGNPTAKAKTSTAKGLHQFTAGTWKDMVGSLGLPYTLEDRADPEKSTEVMREFTKRNIEKAKRDLGKEPTMLDAYFYHFLGRSAPKLLQADEEDDAIKHVTASQAKANKSVFYDKEGNPLKVKDVIGRYKERFK